MPNKNNIFCFIGGSTATEVFNSYKLGSDVVKLFPGELLKPTIIKSFKAPLPFLNFMPTGGINDKNIKEWFDTDAFAVGVISSLLEGLFPKNSISRGNAIGALQVIVQGDNEDLPDREKLKAYMNLNS